MQPVYGGMLQAGCMHLSVGLTPLDYSVSLSAPTPACSASTLYTPGVDALHEVCIMIVKYAVNEHVVA